MEAPFEDPSCRLAQQDAAHVDFHNLPGNAILLNTVTGIIELSERRTELVEVVAQCVRKQVVKDTGDYFGESDHTFGKFQFLLV